MKRQTRKKEDVKSFPEPKKLSSLIGPSFLILATGIGSGEIILWPYLASHYGLGLAWLAVIGITFQYFINMEIERYSLVKGESVFVGLGRISRFITFWLILSTFFTFAIPGTASASAQLISNGLGFENFRLIGIFFLLLIGFITSFGKTVYNTLENFMKYGLIVLFILILAFVIYVSSTSDWIALGNGLIGIGEGYKFIPPGVALLALLGAFAYSGSGGNLNLAQSSYVQEKGYGMGAYAPKIKGLIRKKTLKEDKKETLTGNFFEATPRNIRNFKIWWRRISLEHLIVFWFFGLFMMLLFMLLAYVTIYGNVSEEGIQFAINQGIAIGQTFFPWLGSAFLILIGVFLFQSQLGIYDSASRIIAENYAVWNINKTAKKVDLSKFYHLIIWGQIILGILFFSFGFYEPKTLIITSAVLNSFGMFLHIGFVNYMNHKTLRKEFQAPLWRKILMLLIFLVFGTFFFITMGSYLF